VGGVSNAPAEGSDQHFFELARPRFHTLVKCEVEREENCDLNVINTPHINESV